MGGRFHKWFSWCFLVIAIVIHIIFLSSLFTGVLNPLFYDTEYLIGQGADFFSYYQAGYNVLNGIDIFTVPDPAAVPYLYPYRYLPYFAYSFGVIINLAPPLTAYWIWVGLLTVMIWLSVLRTRSLAEALDRSDYEARIGMGMWLMFSPTYIELYLGQVTLFAGILIFFALTDRTLVDDRKSRGTLALFWIAGSLVKLIPYFITPVLLGAGKVRTVLLAVIVSVIAVFAVPAGLEALRFFIDFNTSRSIYFTGYPGSHSLKMLLYYLLGQPSYDFALITCLLMGLSLIFATFATLYSRDVWMCAALFSTVYFFILTDVWEHHYTFLLPLLVLLWFRGRPEEKSRWIPFVLVILMSLPMMPIVSSLSGLGPGIHPINWEPVWQIVYHSSKVVPTLIFYVWLLVVAFRSPREDLVEVFRNVWDGLIKGSNPSMEGGIIVRTEHDDPSQT